jgi:ABC-type hemin transport system substrate-binding protein
VRRFPPERIVCLTEETVETLYLLDEDARIVGVSGYAVRPARVRKEKPRDEVVAAAPEVIIGSWCGKKFAPQRVKARPGFADIPAVRDGALYEIKSSLILQPGPGALTDGLAELRRIVLSHEAVMRT